MNASPDRNNQQQYQQQQYQQPQQQTNSYYQQQQPQSRQNLPTDRYSPDNTRRSEGQQQQQQQQQQIPPTSPTTSTQFTQCISNGLTTYGNNSSASSHPSLSMMSSTRGVIKDDDVVYLPGVRTLPRFMLERIPFFPANASLQQPSPAPGQGLQYTVHEVQKLFPQHLDNRDGLGNIQPPNPSQAVIRTVKENGQHSPPLQAQIQTDFQLTQLQQLTLPNAILPGLPTQQSTGQLYHGQTAPILVSRPQTGPVVTIPSQLQQSHDVIPYQPFNEPDHAATLIGSIGGIPLRPNNAHHSLVSTHVLLDVQEAGKKIYAENYLNAYRINPFVATNPSLQSQISAGDSQQQNSNQTMSNDINTTKTLPYPFVRYHFPPFDPILNKIINVGNERQELLILARTAENAERYHDMALFARQMAVVTQGRFSREERTVFITAHKHILLPMRQTMRCFKQPYQSGITQILVINYANQIEYEIKTFCKSLIEFVLTIILRATLLTAENHVLFLKFVGDLYRYIAELNPLVDFDACRLSRSYYHDAALLAERYLSITSPIRLGLLLNYSVAAFELFRDYKTACEMIKCAFDKAITRLDELDDEDYRDSTLILQLMRDNLVLWVTMQQTIEKNTPPPVNFPTAFDIQSSRTVPCKYPVELPVNNAKSFLIPRALNLIE